MSGKATSCNVTAIAAATMLQRVNQANKMERRVFRPTNGVKPKKIPMATPPAMALGVSRIASSFNECSLSQLLKFTDEQSPFSVATCCRRFAGRYLKKTSGRKPGALGSPRQRRDFAHA